MSVPRFSVGRIDGGLRVEVAHDGTTAEVSPLWLRERSRVPSQLDLTSGQRLFDPHRLPDDLALVGAAIEGNALIVRFSDGHEEAYALDALGHEIDLGDGCPDPVPWRADLGAPPRHEWRALGGDRGLLAALHDLIAYGMIVVWGAPTIDGTVLDVGSRFGYVRETNFGRLFDVQSVPDANDLAYRAVGLGPHTDNPYRAPVPGIQLLHCLVNDTSGGLSTLVDSIAVTDQLRVDDPEGLELLASTSVVFRFRDADTDLVTRRPVVVTDERGQVTGLHYSPRLDHLPLMPPAETKAYQRARGRLATLLDHASFEIRFRLEAGEVLIFSNDRVLHGRTAYDPQEGHRHLQGCYIDHDAPRSRYRVLRRSHDASEG